MLKTFLGLIALSILVVLFKAQFAELIHAIASLHNMISDKLAGLLTGFSAGALVAHLLSLVLIPIIVALVPAFIYWIIYRSEMPHWLVVVWVIWVMLATIIGMA